MIRSKLFYFLILVLVHFNLTRSIIRDEEINIAAIFQSENTYNPARIGFEDGVKFANNFILRNSMRLKPSINYVTNDDSFEAINSVCRLIEQKSIWAMFTSQSLPINWIIPSIANNLFIPNIQSIWDYSNSKKIFNDDLRTNFTINIYPDASLLSQSFRDWTETSDIKAMTIIYERKEDLIFIKDLLELNSPINKVKISIKEHNIDGIDFKKLLKDSHLKNGDNFILAIPLDKITELIKQADELGMVTEYNKYLITNLDAFSLNYEFLDNNNKNITTLSLINIELLKNEPFYRFASDYKHEQALMFDAVTTFAKALMQLKSSAKQIQSPAVNCRRTSRVRWEDGPIIMNHIKNTMFDGLTGPIMFNENGQRVNFTMRILSLQQYETAFNQTGFWTVEKGVEIARVKKEEIEEDVLKMLRNRRNPMKVATKVITPYIFPNPVGEEEEEAYKDFLSLTQNYTGFCVELLDKLKERLGFEYELVIYNGTSAELLNAVKQQKADLAIADITITKERQAEVDFTMPFLSLGIAILYSKSSAATKDLFSFMQPFHMKVWLLLGTAILGVSLFMYIISRISPYEWVSGHPCEDEPEEMENQFSLGNCIWFVLGSIMQQGSDLAPRAPSTRLLANVWAFFTLIMTSSYTANLAAVLTLSGLEVEIKSVDDLAKQIKVRYGVQHPGSTYNFFRDSQHPVYQRMYSYMESIQKSENVYAKDNNEGVNRVLKGGFAYMMESITLEFFTNQYCNLTQIGNLLDRKGYGITFKQGSPYTSLMSNAILKLQEEQYLSNLRTKWFNEYPAKLRQMKNPLMSECPKIDVSSSGAKEMEVTDVGGVFIVLVAGLSIGILFSLAEIWWKAKKIARHEREPVCTLIMREFYRVLTLGGSTSTNNPLLLTKSSSTNKAGTSMPRSSIAPQADQIDQKSDKTKRSTKDLSSNKKDRKQSKATTNLSKKGTNTTLDLPEYNISMDANGLPLNSRDSYHQLNLTNNSKEFDDEILNNSIEMNPILENNSILGNNSIIEPPASFANGNINNNINNINNINNKKQYDYNHQNPSYLSRRDSSNTLPHEPYTNGVSLNSRSFTSPPAKSKSKKQQPTNFNSDINGYDLRRRSYLTESPIKWPKPSTNNYDVYQ